LYLSQILSRHIHAYRYMNVILCIVTVVVIVIALQNCVLSRTDRPKQRLCYDVKYLLYDIRIRRGRRHVQREIDYNKCSGRNDLFGEINGNRFRRFE